MSEEFKDRLLSHAKKAVDRAGKATNEEATKQFLIIPFFDLLGYDPHDPDEIVPEADASFSEKFKNRVDYAINKDGEPVIAVEAKKAGSLSAANRGELKGYYNAVPTVKLGVLTDGLIYQLYSDTDQENLMDDEPLAVANLTEIAQDHLAEDTFDALLKLRRGTFDPADVGADARRKIYISAYVEAIEQAFKEPGEGLVRTFLDLAKIEGRRNKRLVEEHKVVLSEAMNKFFDKKLLERVGFAERVDLVRVPPTEASPTSSTSEVYDDLLVKEQARPDTSNTTTTEAELRAFDYVRHRLPFLIDRDEALFHKLDHIFFRDRKGTFTVSYKQDRKGRLFNLRETTDGKYRFDFPESGKNLVTDALSEIDSELLAIFLKRVEELG